MEISRIRALRGPNLWSRHTAIEAIVSCTGSERCLSDIPEFEPRLRERFPEIALLQPTIHDEMASMAHALEFATLGLQAQAGCPVTFSRTTQTIEEGIYQVVVEYSEEAVGRLALELAQKLCLAAIHDTAFDLADALKTNSAQEKTRLYKDAQDTIWKESPWVPLVVEKLVSAHSKTLTGFYIMPDTGFSFDNADLKQ